ncbi:protein GET1 isoform X2 [Diospyros lotus]|uniref:protein GET1 isoform X2 n=1 Tax=Diospyros lotus TaxID=55363 RepID=UPI002256AE41|nr:protein GET1 isoform X2 [Diospyros lotus]XP_052191623.1 protein GET1 isoform X2 [Diospyros lotus]
MEETMAERGRSLAAPVVFMVVVAFQILSRLIEKKKRRGSNSAVEAQLRVEIKQLYKEAASLSQPSTFAQAAKLRRMAANKEKDLAKIQELHSKEMKLSYGAYSKGLTILKGFTYFLLICWFWRVPVAAISKQLVEPFGKVLSWRAGGPLNDNVMVGIIPWLILSTRVGKIICRKVFQ